MKKMKKFLAMMLAMAMVLGMAITASAENEKATITVTNAEDATITYVQVIKADPTKETGWTFVNEAETYYKQAFNSSDEQTIIWQLILSENPEAKGAPTGLDPATAQQIDTALDLVRQHVVHIDQDVVKNVITVSEVGVYAIKAIEEGFSYKEMAAYVEFADASDGVYSEPENKTINAKKSSDGIEEKSNNDSDGIVHVGDIVTYTIKGQVPYFNVSDTDKVYKIVDIISGAEYLLSGEGAVTKVEIPGYTKTISLTAENVTKNGDGSQSFTLDLSEVIDDANTYAGKTVTITYTAKVVASATNSTVAVSNSASVINGSNVIVGSTKEDKLYTGDITLTKYASDNNNDDLSDNEKLSGAKFKVYVLEGTTEKYATFDANNVFTGWVNSESEATVIVTAGKEGKVVVKGLDKGTYYFKETEAPKGYSLNTEPVTAEIKLKDGETKASANISVNAEPMIDTKLNSLPSTGGIGTTIFTIGGCAIMIIAAGLYFSLRRKSAK